MAATRAPGQSIERLAHDLAGDAADAPFLDELTGWLASSPPFRAFATTYRDKIHKKLRTAPEAEARRDVRAELDAAWRLLDDARFRVAYEAHGAGKAGPDFTVTFRDGPGFDLEVTRLRKLPEPAALGATILAKLRQLPPSTPNVLVLAADGPDAAALDITAAVGLIRVRADARDDAFFAARGLETGRGFYERFLRLGVVIAWCEAGAGDARAAMWTNRSARIAVPAPAARACLAAFRADPPDKAADR